MSSSDNELPPPPRPSSGRKSKPHSSSTKRSHDSDSGNSSDSAFFSSDDLADASLARYASTARKAQYKRAWFEAEHPSRLHSYRQMRTATRRPKDSGVYLSSDSSNSSVDDGFAVDGLRATASRTGPRRMQPFSRPVPRTRPSADSIVDAHVAECLDAGRETLDLMGLALEHISNDAFLPLRQLVRHPKFDPSAYTEESLQPLIPSLQIYLAGNSLQSVPSSLLALDTIKVLSLRGNQLSELPPSIGRSPRLTELNVASNRLRWLPWDLLALCQSARPVSFFSRPNPFFRLTPDPLSPTEDGQDGPVLEAEEDVPKGRFRYVGSSPFSFFQQCGSLHPLSPPAPSQRDADTLAISQTPKRALQRQAGSRAPSLFEVALQACADSPALDRPDEYLDPESPPAVLQGLARARKAVQQGGSQCSVCRRAYIIARAEWIEFWGDASVAGQRNQDSALPFLRRACSYSCAMDASVSG